MVFKTLVIIYLATSKLLCYKFGGDLSFGPLKKISEFLKETLEIFCANRKNGKMGGQMKRAIRHIRYTRR